MKVIDHEPQWWFLLEEEGAYFLDASCSHSFLGYDFTMQLNGEEVANYHRQGHPFINWLAEDIHNSVPILKVSTSPYKARRATEALSDKVSAAILVWNQAVSPP